MNSQTSKSVSKREKISKASSTVFASVAIASTVVMFCLISMKFLWTKQGYNARVITAKIEARDQIEENNRNLDKLIKDFSSILQFL